MSKRKFYFSIKYKILIYLSIFLVTSLSAYFVFAIQIFEEDKIAYVYTSGIHRAKNFKYLNQRDQLLLAEWKHNVKKMIESGKLQELSRNLIEKDRTLFIQIKDGNNVLAELRNQTLSNIEKTNILNTISSDVKTLDKVYVLKKYNSYAQPFLGWSTKLEINNKVYSLILAYNNTEIVELLNSKNRHSFILNENAEIVLNFVDSITPDFIKNTNLILNKIKELKSRAGTIEYQINNFKYLISFENDKNSKLYYLSLMKKDKALEATKKLQKKSFAFLLIAISLAAILSIFAVRRLTSTLKRLHEGALKIGAGDFDTYIEPTSNDETTILSETFNEMTSTIKKQLQELKEYSELLEEKVKLRTKELAEAMELQKTMLDNVSQGFFIFEKDGKILPEFSQVTEVLFEKSPLDKNFAELLQYESSESETLIQFCNAMLDEAFPFDDMRLIAPKDYTNSKGRKIFLDYFPVRDLKEKVKNVVVVSVDKTDEIMAKEKAQMEHNFALMVQKILSNKNQFINVLKDILTYIDHFEEKSVFDNFDEIARYLHTIKGTTALYGVYGVNQFVSMFEEQFLNLRHNLKKDDKNINKKVYDQLLEIKNITIAYVKDNSELLGFNDIYNVKNFKTLNDDLVKDFLMELKRSHSPSELIEKYITYFYATTANELIKPYLSLVEDLSIQLDKEIKIEIINGDTPIISDIYKDLYSSFVHIVRNTADHGIETKSEREATGKNKKAKLQFKHLIDSNNLNIIISDDGKGIDLSRISAIINEKFKVDPETLSEAEILQYLFKSGFSSKDISTDISGKGVGLDAVKFEVTKLGGKIEIESIQSQGTTFKIQVPYSLTL